MAQPKPPPALTTRSQIIEAAAACFELRGIQKTTMQQVAAQAGLSRQTVYDNFDNKIALVTEVMLVFSRQSFSETWAAIDFDGSAEAIISAAQRELTSRYRTRRGKMLLSTADRKITSEIAGRIRIQDISCDEFWIPLIERLRAQEKVDRDIDAHRAARWLYLVNYAYNQYPEIDGDLQNYFDAQYTAKALRG